MLTILSPEEGYNKTFLMPVMAWDPVLDAVDYLVEVYRDAGLTDLVESTTTSTTTWVPTVFHMGYQFHFRVTAQPLGVSATRAYTVRGLRPAPSVISPNTFCGGVGTGLCWSVAYSNGKIFGGENANGSGVCVYDAETLAHLETFGARGGTFRMMGVGSDQAHDRVFAVGYWQLGSCSNTLNRVALVTNASNTSGRALTWLNAGIETPINAMFNGTTVFFTGLNTMSCYNYNCDCDGTYVCGDSRSCHNGEAGLLAWNPDVQQHLWHTAVYARPAGAADANRIYRSTYSNTVRVEDASNGSTLFSIPVSGTADGVMLHTDGTNHYLLVTIKDGLVEIFKFTTVPVTTATDVVKVNQMMPLDSYWQGDIDPAGRFYFPTGNARKIHRHDLMP